MRVAILGGGPAGSGAAALLSGRGLDVALFNEPNGADPIAGESLVPGVVPILRRLGIEENVARIGVRKPGVSFFSRSGKSFHFGFDSLPSKFPPYAYNVPRPAFDHLLFDAAVSAGAEAIPAHAGVVADGDHLRLEPAALDLVPRWRGRQPDLVIDASGRRRLAARALSISARIGPRQDVAHFAHYEGFPAEVPAGQVRITHMAHGWSWQIPLQGKMSFGIVLDRTAAAALGSDPESRLDAAIRNHTAPGAVRRITGVKTYGNYQLVSDRGAGANWAAVGDAFGFVDPMLSPGMMLALQSAEILDASLARLPLAGALESYAGRVTALLTAWMDFISYFYDGRIFYMHETGMRLRERHPCLPTGIPEALVRRNLASMASGFSTGSPFSVGVLRGFERFCGRDEPAIRELAIV
jgi:flavin-dependent dehydrogenase